jgi:triacylglycerol lipase
VVNEQYTPTLALPHKRGRGSGTHPSPIKGKGIRSLALACLIALTGCGGSGGGSSEGARFGASTEPALETDLAALDAALLCTPFTHPDKPPVLLVHGTFTAGYEQYEWNYLPLLAARGFDVCAVTYPDRGLGDQQISAEYVVHALRSIHAATGRKVAMIGHSQGATMPRWALKWWPSTRNAVADFVLIAGPNHGTLVADPTGQGQQNPLGMPAAFYQFSAGSNFITALNAGDETPGDIEYTNLYALTDELVQPVLPEPTAALDWGQNNPRVANILMQDVCPLNVVDHVTIGTTDRIAFELAVDAISNPGPADVARAGGMALCLNPLPLIADPALASEGVTILLDILQRNAEAGLPELHLTTEEPPLKPYAL